MSFAVDVRVVAASNRDLEAAVKEASFRADLYYRLAVVTIRIPPLRERREDLVPLSEFFLARTCRELGKGPKAIVPGALEALERYPWPGNIRELENAVARAVALSECGEITSADLCFGLADPEGSPPPSTPEEERFHDSVREHKRAVLRRAIAKAGGNKTRAAEILGLSPTYLFRLIRVLGIEG